MTENNSFRCHFCSYCDGCGCIGEMPGMGGPNQSRNFLLNCEGWKKIRNENNIPPAEKMPEIRLAPITGGVENIGYPDEKQFYSDLIKKCSQWNFPLSIGDGTPDFKLKYGIEAVEANGKKAAVFIKPYANSKILERIEWAENAAEIIGIDIDSYNIVTMRNLVKLEKKTESQLNEIKNLLHSKGIPFAIKGVFTETDLETVKKVNPDIIYISNHGGRVDTVPGSTAEFLLHHHKELLSCCNKLWVDGGLRSEKDFLTAASLGVSTVLLGRPFITALCRGDSKLIF